MKHIAQPVNGKGQDISASDKNYFCVAIRNAKLSQQIMSLKMFDQCTCEMMAYDKMIN